MVDAPWSLLPGTGDRCDIHLGLAAHPSVVWVESKDRSSGFLPEPLASRVEISGHPSTPIHPEAA